MSMYLQCKQISTMMALRSWQTVHPHRPLIRFRNGPMAVSSERPSTISSVQVAAPPSAPSAPSGGSRKWSVVHAGPVLEEWQVPARYRRLPMDEKEMEAINMGGSA
ncbi:28S ribosomal protein S36, mitochondrial-like [Pollicipes pollicipes]|uniref:28S ribosomal protein S36, mitochondrial-like n=1 Tax=Pollicipes pollicipes TaxID=41117 RepID=UPI0018855044|nr:28S ribosomal protein S36, mitochondrial-like [Pollicipes pollicipes]